MIARRMEKKKKRGKERKRERESERGCRLWRKREIELKVCSKFNSIFSSPTLPVEKLAQM